MKRGEGWGYFDTSVLVKRYVAERGSRQARNLLRRYRFVSSVITPVETVSALSRRRLSGEISGQDFARVLSWIRRDRAYWELIEMTALVLGQAEELLQKIPLRTLDALHLASAVIFQSVSEIQIRFITADIRQTEAAKQLGLEVVWAGRGN